MWPVATFGPRPVKRDRLPRTWALGPAADGQAADSARSDAHLSPSWAKSGIVADRTPMAVGFDPTAVQSSRRNKTRERPAPTGNPRLNSFSSLFWIDRSGRWRRRLWRLTPGKKAAPPRLPRRCARSTEGERAAVEVAACGAPVLEPGRVPRAGVRDGDQRPEFFSADVRRHEDSIPGR